VPDETDKYGSAEATTVIVLEPVGVAYETPFEQANTPLVATAKRTTPISIIAVVHAPRIMRRRIQKSSRPVRLPSHHSMEPCAGELGGLLINTVSVVVSGGFGLPAVLAITISWPGEKTQMEFAGSEEATH
jgi:hypothetical protein